MDRSELRDLIVGPIANVPTPFDDRFRVDYGRMAELTEWWVESGLVKGKAVIKVAVVMGEIAHMRDDEWGPLLKTTVQAAKDNATVMCGIHYKDTLRTIEDVKRAADLGAVGVQVAPPIFNDPTQDDILRFFEDVSNAIDIGVMIYNTHWMPYGNVEPETFRRMRDFENIVAVKWSPGPGAKMEDLYDMADWLSIIENSGNPIRGHMLGAMGYINQTADAYPPHDLRFWDLVTTGKYDEAQALYDSVNVPLGAFHGRIQANSGGVARTKKGMMALMGRPIGSSRPPSQALSEAENAELRDLLISFGWPVGG